MSNSPENLFINGAWREGSSQKRFNVIDPATEKIIATVADGSVADAKDSMDAAAAALVDWRATVPRERGEILRRAHDMLIANEQRLAKLITLENGKALPDSLAEIRYAAEFFRWFAEEAVRNLGRVSLGPSSGARILVQHRAAGVAVLVTPWNFPAAMGARKLAPALAAGCTVVLKPASETPLTLLAIGDLLARAGVPSGVINLLPTSNPKDVVSALLNDSRTRVVSFTGSTEVGKQLLKKAAERVINPAMELGGNAPFIVLADANVEAAIEGAIVAKMRNIGEACTAANRLYIHSNVYDEFVTGFVIAMKKLKMGNGMDPDVQVGALINESTRNKVAAFVDDAVSKGARLLLGGKVPPGPGYFYPPTVLVDVPAHANCTRGEIFGPVAAIQCFDENDDIVAIANDTDYGLVAYLYTQDIKRGLEICERFEFGMVGLNRGLVSDPAAPFGGMKQSGIGREGGHEGLMEFLESQYIATDW